MAKASLGKERLFSRGNNDEIDKSSLICVEYVVAEVFLFNLNGNVEYACRCSYTTLTVVLYSKRQIQAVTSVVTVKIRDKYNIFDHNHIILST